MAEQIAMHVAPIDKRNAPSRDAPLMLQKDAWDDFGFKTQYHVYYFGAEFEGFLGNVKILRRDQGITSDSILAVGPLAPLGDEFCSLGQSLDYYERIAALPPTVRDTILSQLRDALFEPDHAAGFKEEKGWGTSIIRDLDLDNYAPLAQVLLERDYNALPSAGFTLNFAPAHWQAPLHIDFSEPDAPSYNGLVRLPALPGRLAVIAGRNGSGKSTLLARLARVMHATQADRQRAELLQLGSIEPAGIGFSRIITVAYSAFDTFQIPGVDAAEKRQIAKDLQAGTGRYVFAGLRDIAGELEETLDAEQAAEVAQPDLFTLDRQESTHLKSADRLADEYAAAVKRIYAEDRTGTYLQVLNLLLADPSFADTPDASALLALSPRQSFMRWSTGHKIVLHATAMMLAHVQRKSMILIDEPESHLHPPLLAAFMHGIRLMLDQYDAFAIVATHSPVVAQETLGRHVSVITRVGDVITINRPRIETYGESIGEITNEVFGLHAEATDFHKILRGLVAGGLSLVDIDGRFDHGLSLQARAYVMSLVASRQDGV
ncbi:AAA family ATPase [Sphingobium yanoikuyae]|nr:AAA family ATPase [Sphingobium yanoikuyae]